MANMFSQLAKMACTFSSMKANREKITTEEIIAKYPDGVTITEFDIATSTNQDGSTSTYPIMVFAEDDTKYLYGGKALMEIVTMWLANFEGDVEATSNALKDAGGVKIKMHPSKTRAGNKFTAIEIVG